MLQHSPAIVLSDLRLPEGDGFGVLRASKEFDADTPVIVMTAYGSIEDAVAAMKEGALDFLAKPVDPDHLALLVARALEQRRMVTENLLLKEELGRATRCAPAGRRGPVAAEGVCQPAEGGGDRHDGAARGRERDRQGALRPIAARAQPAGRGAVCRHQLRGHSRDPARDRALRTREGRLHRRRRAQARQVRDGAPRDAVPRRNRRPAARAPGQDSARARRAPFRTRRRDGDGASRRPPGGGDQSRPARRRRGAAVPRRSVLPALGVSDHRAAAARSVRRHSARSPASSSSASAAT